MGCISLIDQIWKFNLLQENADKAAMWQMDAFTRYRPILERGQSNLSLMDGNVK